MALRNREIGLKFHRQYSIGSYGVDFCSFEARLAVELDGDAHPQPSQMKKDAAKEG